MQKNKIRVFFANKNQSGSGGVVSAPKRKTFDVEKKKCFGNMWPGGTACSA